MRHRTTINTQRNQRRSITLSPPLNALIRPHANQQRILRPIRRRRDRGHLQINRIDGDDLHASPIVNSSFKVPPGSCAIFIKLSCPSESGRISVHLSGGASPASINLTDSAKSFGVYANDVNIACSLRIMSINGSEVSFSPMPKNAILPPRLQTSSASLLIAVTPTASKTKSTVPIFFAG